MYIIHVFLSIAVRFFLYYADNHFVSVFHTWNISCEVIISAFRSDWACKLKKDASRTRLTRQRSLSVLSYWSSPQKKLQWNIWTHRVGHEHKLTKFLTIGTFCANNKETERLAELDNIVFTRAIHLYLLFNMSGLNICYSHKDKNISRILTLFRTTPKRLTYHQSPLTSWTLDPKHKKNVQNWMSQSGRNILMTRNFSKICTKLFTIPFQWER